MLGKLISSLAAIFTIFSLYSPAIFAEQDFKCYIELSNQTAIIENQFANTSEQAKEKIKQRFANDKSQLYSIIAIEECITIQKKFSTFQANSLDIITPQ